MVHHTSRTQIEIRTNNYRTGLLLKSEFVWIEIRVEGSIRKHNKQKEKERCTPRQKPRVERLKAKVEPLLTQVTVENDIHGSNSSHKLSVHLHRCASIPLFVSIYLISTHCFPTTLLPQRHAPEPSCRLVLNSRTPTSQKCTAVPRRARI